MNTGLEMEIVWEDEDMISLRVHAKNASFMATAECYTTRDYIDEVRVAISGYPVAIDQEVSFGTGASEHISFFKCTFKPTFSTGKYMAAISIAHIFTDSARGKDHSNVYLEFQIEPASIDNFVSSLSSLSKGKVGEVTACLHGIDLVTAL